MLKPTNLLAYRFSRFKALKGSPQEIAGNKQLSLYININFLVQWFFPPLYREILMCNRFFHEFSCAIVFLKGCNIMEHYPNIHATTIKVISGLIRERLGKRADVGNAYINAFQLKNAYKINMNWYIGKVMEAVWDYDIDYSGDIDNYAEQEANELVMEAIRFYNGGTPWNISE